MSCGLSPASCSALSAASACRPISERCGITPSSVVSAAPTMATDPVRLHQRASFAGLEERQRDLVAQRRERDLERHVELQRLGRLRAVDDVGHHARPLVQLDHGDRVGRREARRRPVVDDVAVEARPAAGVEDLDLARAALRAERARREVGLRRRRRSAAGAARPPRAVPEVPRLRRRLRAWALGIGRGHVSSAPGCGGAAPPGRTSPVTEVSEASSFRSPPPRTATSRRAAADVPPPCRTGAGAAHASAGPHGSLARREDGGPRRTSGAGASVTAHRLARSAAPPAMVPGDPCRGAVGRTPAAAWTARPCVGLSRTLGGSGKGINPSAARDGEPRRSPPRRAGGRRPRIRCCPCTGRACRSGPAR